MPVTADDLHHDADIKKAPDGLEIHPAPLADWLPRDSHRREYRRSPSRLSTSFTSGIR